MSNEQIRLRSVYELRVDEIGAPIRYFIPAYQRGYRWNDTQVTQLLEDIREFARRKPPPEEFYCLQPLVLMGRKDSAYEVVDGQQRLTTLLLILRHFNDRAAKKYQRTLYSLEYETRHDLIPFLENPTDEMAAKNIDYFHILQAIKVIESWFEARESEIAAIEDAFLNQAKVIWFQLSERENPVAAFTRLNVGKIPLTNAELIRALLLKDTPNRAPESRRLQIAHEWDLVEKELQDGDFWSFVSNDTRRSGGRIDFLFNLVAHQQGMKVGLDEYQTFNHFSRKLDENNYDPAAIWLKVKQVHMLLGEWYEDRHLYHLAGFLIWDDVDVSSLIRLAEGTRKSELKVKLRNKIIDRAFGLLAPTQAGDVALKIGDRLDGLVYPRDRTRIKSILLLFNLATLLQHPSSNIRFNFESFKMARWDIEHVRSSASAQLGSPTLQENWLTQTLRYLELTEQEPAVIDLQETIRTHLSRTPRERASLFEPLYGRLLEHFHENDIGDPDNSVGNLTLLDQETNRSYQNAVFPVKRQRVIELDRHGVFIPHCTRNVFLKSYSPQVGHTMYWTQQDRDCYRQELINTLTKFISGEWIHG